MLLELMVKGFGIIDDINWRPGPGLNVITGETGAGKSLVIDAVETLLAGRIDEDSIRYGDDESYIEGIFSLPASEMLSRLLAESGVTDDANDSLIVSCELRRKGRSVARLNRRAVPGGTVYQIGCRLIDIHGQSDHLSLLNSDYHLDFLDAYGRTLEKRQAFAEKTAALGELEQEIMTLAREEQELTQREELLRFQIEEIERANLNIDEEDSLEQERKVLLASEEIKAAATELYQTLYGDDSAPEGSIIEGLGRAAVTARRLAGLDPGLKPQLDLLEATAAELKEAARDIHAYAEGTEYNPARLEEIEGRLELIRSLKRKYGKTVTDVLSYLETARAEITRLGHSSERRSELEAAREHLKIEMGELASTLSEQREAAAVHLAAEVKQELNDLLMPQIQFEASLHREEDPNGIPYPDGKIYAFTKRGADITEFRAATNPGEPLKPLVKIASTGEISRFMLALKGALSRADDVPILVFDEIDIGVGGRCGEVIGRKLWTLARNHQVICITHLPQIAAYADSHYHIRKETHEARARSILDMLEGEVRIKELAAMLGGINFSEAAVESARALVAEADSWKQAQG